MSQTADDLLHAATKRQRQHRASRCTTAQKEIGQFFTPPEVARLMASMLTRFPKCVRILDPGAGAGILAAAVCERVAALREPRDVEVHAYETDSTVLPALRETLERCRKQLKQCGHRVEVVVHPQDFLLAGPTSAEGLFKDQVDSSFDVVIMNPPYLKIPKQSRYAAVMADEVHGQPNLYALFMALGAQLVRPGGQFVAITPRSFCNGPYFRRFRTRFLSRMRLERLHLFESRKDAFADSDVLQENVITYARCRRDQAGAVRVTSSYGRDIPAELKGIDVPSEAMVCRGRDRIIRIPTSESELALIERLDRWPHTLASAGLRVSTGPVVLFRAREFVRPGATPNGLLPLLLVQNVRPFQTIWPCANTRKVLLFEPTEESRKLLVPARNYVLVRRFSAKEEKRRLTASVLPADAFGGHLFALENHLNYIYHADRELSVDEAFGIAALLNCSIVDQYFRAVSGNTQVNVAELRTLPFPELTTVAQIGQRARRAGPDVLESLDGLISDTLGLNGKAETLASPKAPTTPGR